MDAITGYVVLEGGGSAGATSPLGLEAEEEDGMGLEGIEEEEEDDEEGSLYSSGWESEEELKSKAPHSSRYTSGCASRMVRQLGGREGLRPAVTLVVAAASHRVVGSALDGAAGLRDVVSVVPEQRWVRQERSTS